MNGSLFEDDGHALLEKLNNDELQYLLPSIVWLFAVSLFGIPGNIFTLIFYRKGCMKSNYKLFILTVASIDLLSCCLAIPLENFLLLSGYAEDDRHEPICKLSRFSNFFMTCSSAFVLVLIAVERYRKVCRPFDRQLSHTLAQKLCVGALLLGILVTWPSALVFGKKTLTAVAYGREITAVICSVSDKAIASETGFIYLIIMFVLGVVCITICVVLYSLIGCKIKRESVRQLKGTRKMLAGVENQDIAFNNTQEGDKENCGPDDVSKRTVAEELACNTKESKTSSPSLNEESTETSSNQPDMSSQKGTEKQSRNLTDCTKSTEHNKLPRKTSTKRRSRKILNQARASQTSRVMFIISAIYVVSYIPNLTLMILESVIAGFYDHQSPNERAVSNFFIRLYFLNCGVNPYVYALCDSSFRSAVRNLFLLLKHRLCR